MVFLRARICTSLPRLDRTVVSGLLSAHMASVEISNYLARAAEELIGYDIYCIRFSDGRDGRTHTILEPDQIAACLTRS